MTRKEFLESLYSIEVNSNLEKKLLSKYKMDIPEIILKTLSKYPVPELFDENESRTISVEEVMNAEEDNGVPFASVFIIPIVELGDNDFIVFDGNNHNWCIYNILDEITFDKTDTFEELFLK